MPSVYPYGTNTYDVSFCETTYDMLLTFELRPPEDTQQPSREKQGPAVSSRVINDVPGTNPAEIPAEKPCQGNFTELSRQMPEVKIEFASERFYIDFAHPLP